jgi:peptide chain release factor subunit 1
VVPQSNSAAIFACFGQDEFFEAIQLAAPMDQNSLHIGRQPHLYPLAKISSQYRRYACLIADTHAARIYVFGTGKRLGQEDIVNEKTHRVQMGGWSQARYQRHVDHYRLHHVKEVIETLSKIVKAEGIPQVFISGDEVIIPKIREQLTPELKALVVDELKLPMNTPEKTILEATLKAAREQDGEEKKIKQLLDQYRSGALGVAGARATLQALDAGQVNELVICADPNAVINDLQPDEAEIIASGTPVTDPITTDSFNSRIAEALVLRARQTGAEITFIENPELLSGLGGTGAFLRYRI